MSDTLLREQLWNEACRLGKSKFQAKACIPCEDTDTDQLLTRAADRIQQLTAERDALAERVAELGDALIRLRDCDFVITPTDRMDAVRKIAREALNKEQP